MSVRDLIIVGAGPSGLSAAIAAKQRSLDYLVVEQGVLVNSIFNFPPQMVFFTTPELLEIGGLPFVTPFDKPTRLEALRYYRKVADKYDLQISFDEKVLSIQREADEGDGDGDRIFEIETRTSHGVRRVRLARTVILSIGYYDHPNVIGVPGEDLPHVRHYYREPHLHYRQRVVIVGGGNSAAEAALEMYRAGAKVTIVHRAPQLKKTIKYWVRPDIENRIKEGSVAARFGACVKEIRPTSVVIVRAGGVSEADGAGRVPSAGRGADAIPGPAAWGGTAPRALPDDAGEVKEACAPMWSGIEEELPAEAVYLLTGYRADADLMCRAGVLLNERQAPVVNPHTFETNVPSLFVAGGAIAGVDTGTVFIENGRFHGEKIVEVIAARLG
jgi:thioredoxin reductase (NADPH)